MIQEGFNQVSFPWWFTVYFVVFIIAFEYTTYSYYFLFNIFLEKPFINFLITSVFEIFFIFLVISYYKAVTYSPGFIPNHINNLFTNIEEIKERASEELKIKVELRRKKLLTGGGIAHENFGKAFEDKPLNSDEKSLPFDMTLDSFCFKCSKIKPPRAHHCKECKRCVMRMDHHCVWVGNCVGLNNHKYFILFLFYASACLSIVFFHISYNWAFDDFSVNRYVKGNQILIITTTAASSAAMALAIGYLFCFQIWCIKKNVTTVEFHIPQMLTNTNPFKKSTFLENAKEIFGLETKKWMLPFAPFRKDYSNELEFHELKL